VLALTHGTLLITLNGKLLSFDPYRRVAFFMLGNVLYITTTITSMAATSQSLG